MARGRIAAILVASVLVASAVLALSFQPRSEPRERVLVTLEAGNIQACFLLFLVDARGNSTPVHPPCVHLSDPMLPGTYSGGADIQMSFPLTFLDRGNATCPGWYLDRYNVFYGTVFGFGVENDFRVESWSPITPWDVIGHYGEPARVVIQMPDTPYQGPLNLTLTGEMRSYDWESRCPPG